MRIGHIVLGFAMLLCLSTGFFATLFFLRQANVPMVSADRSGGMISQGNARGREPSCVVSGSGSGDFASERILPGCMTFELFDPEQERRSGFATFGQGALTLIDFTAPNWTVRQNGKFRFERQWYVRKSPSAADEPRIDVYIHPAQPGWLWHISRGGHDAYPIERWKTGSVVKERYSVTVPGDMPRGTYPVTVGIWMTRKDRWLDTTNSSAERPGMTLVGSLTVTR